eukprot:TRINITY_DN30460_c0_g1_i1.p1 TRINITY_DN30460_c0_g1~~TRINITY_DN30460_c0_g1_i1.p1  ORF type:complete len:126 (+),score=51.00 TRINITY_DN30460_c0_g1_i1:111-488(+)
MEFIATPLQNRQREALKAVTPNLSDATPTGSARKPSSAVRSDAGGTLCMSPSATPMPPQYRAQMKPALDVTPTPKRDRVLFGESPLVTPGDVEEELVGYLDSSLCETPPSHTARPVQPLAKTLTE